MLVFTLLAPALVALWTASLVTSLELDPPLFFAAVAAALGVSAVHLGRRARAWRAALNLRRSWLSREVALYLAFALLVLPGHPLPGWAAALAGFGALYSMDRLYDVTLVRRPWRLHSADAALSGLLAAGLLAGSPLPSLLAGATKLFLYLGRRARGGRGDAVRGALRLGLGLLFPALLWIAGPEGWLAWALAGLAFGECIDRWEFYREIDLLTPERQLAADLRRLLAGRAAPAR